MASILTIQVNDPLGTPVAGASVSFAPDLVSFPPPGVHTPMVGGLTDLLGRYSRTFLIGKVGAWFYTVSVTAPGFQVATLGIAMIDDFYAGGTVTLTYDPLGSGLVALGVPALVSVGQAPGTEYVNLPYTPYSYVETAATPIGGNSVLIETNINPNGSCSVPLRDRFQIDPRPTLVNSENVVLADTAMSRAYTLVSTLVSGATRRPLFTWNTTALLLDCPDPLALIGRWLPASGLVVTKGQYADAAILLIAGSYTLRRNAGTGFDPLPDISFTVDGKTIARARIPAVSGNLLTMWIMQGSVKISNDLTIIYR